MTQMGNAQIYSKRGSQCDGQWLTWYKWNHVRASDQGNCRKRGWYRWWRHQKNRRWAMKRAHVLKLVTIHAEAVSSWIQRFFCYGMYDLKQKRRE